MAERKPAKTETRGKASDGFTDEERAAMKELTSAEEAKIRALVKRAVR